MDCPDFFAHLPELTLRDPLAELLGAAKGGQLTYRYQDAVKLAGHSCPTVAGAWLMACRGLATLYPDDLPERGALQVELRAAQEEGHAGVVGAILGFITGAAGVGGFKGLGGRYVRRDLLRFGAELEAEARLTRLDNGRAVLLDYHPERVPASAELTALMGRVMSANATSEERATFARLWQDRVRRILLEHGDDPMLVVVRPATCS